MVPGKITFRNIIKLWTDYTLICCFDATSCPRNSLCACNLFGNSSLGDADIIFEIPGEGITTRSLGADLTARKPTGNIFDFGNIRTPQIDVDKLTFRA